MPDPALRLDADQKALVLAVGDLLVRHFERTPAPVSAPGLSLTAIECAQLEDRVGFGATKTAATLLAAVDRLGSIRIGDVRLSFTPGQLRELQHRAEKRGHTIEEEVRAVVERIQDDLFWHGG